MIIIRERPASAQKLDILIKKKCIPKGGPGVKPLEP